MRHRPAALSGGEQQRVAIARALVHDAPLIVADEPTAHLDYVQVESVLELVRGLAVAGRLVIVATHDDRLTPLADRVIHLTPRARVAGGVHEVQLAAGDVLFEMGEELIGRRGPAEVFGDIGPLLGLPRSASAVLREPLRALAAPATIWGVGAIAFGPIMGAIESSGAQEITEMTLTAALGGVTTCVLVYLLTERLLRPVTALALAGGPPERPAGPSVRTRLITTWALTTGVPLLGLGLLALRALGGHISNVDPLAIAVLVLAGGGLAAGSIATVLSASSLAEPITAVREALGRVRSGDLDVHVKPQLRHAVGVRTLGMRSSREGRPHRPPLIV